MHVGYDKKEINSLKHSGIFLQFVLLLCLVFMIYGKDIAVFIVTAPIIGILTLKNIKLFVYLYQVKKHKIYLKLSDEKLSYNSIFDETVEIELQNIKNIQFGDDGILICLKKDLDAKRKRTSQRLLKYYLEDTEGIYKIPILAKKMELKKVYDIIKQKVKGDFVIKDSKEFVNLCGAYIFILAGILWGFLFQLMRQTDLQQSFFELIFFIIAMTLVHLFDKQTLCSGQLNIGLLIRCIGCSMTIAQYILCSCQIEKVIKGASMSLSVSPQSFFVVSIIYLSIFVLFIPRNAIGKKFTSYCVQKRDERNKSRNE